jgi:NAD(P)-dependent dehydrogenase (short-subunit alcohol dehydrogenase family)
MIDHISKTWLITGASGGFGRHAAEQALTRGHRVALLTRRADRLQDLVDGHGADRVWVAPLDVTDTARLRAVVDEAFVRFGRIDVVLSNAGYGLFGAAEEVSDEQLDRQLGTNLVAPMQLLRASLPGLRAQGGGRWLQVVSSGGEVPDPGMSLYNATKYGLEGFFESAAVELAPLGVDITLIVPGGSRTHFNSALDVARPLDAYDHTAVGQIRGLLSGGGDPEILRRALVGDPAKIASAILTAADTTPAPRRVVLTSTAYDAIEAALEHRLIDLRAQRDVAYDVDADDVIAARIAACSSSTSPK